MFQGICWPKENTDQHDSELVTMFHKYTVQISSWSVVLTQHQDFPRHLAHNYITRARFDGGQFSEPIM